MKIDLNGWKLVSNSNERYQAKIKPCGVRVALRQPADGKKYASFGIAEKTAAKADIAIGDRVSVLRSEDGKMLLIAKDENGTHKFTCTKSEKKVGTYRSGYFKWTVGETEMHYLGFVASSESYEMEILEISEGYIAVACGRPKDSDSVLTRKVKEKQRRDENAENVTRLLRKV